MKITSHRVRKSFIAVMTLRAGLFSSALVSQELSAEIDLEEEFKIT